MNPLPLVAELCERVNATLDSQDRINLNVSDSSAEYQAATQSVALFDLTGRTQIEITGNDRRTFLHNFCTNDVKSLASGSSCEAFITNIKGRVLGHVFVFASETSLWLDTVAGQDEALIAHLDRYIITEDVQLVSRTDELAVWMVSGPGSAGVRSVVDCDADGLQVRPADWLGQPGFQCVVGRGRAADVSGRLTEAGVLRASEATFEALRIEALLPVYGRDVSEDNLAQEVARTQQAISFNKGCYLGQEPIARIDAMGHVNRELCGLKLASVPVPVVGSAVLAGASEVGQVTSSVLSPGSGLPVVLGYLRAGSTGAGTELRVQADGEDVAAVVFRGE